MRREIGVQSKASKQNKTAEKYEMNSACVCVRAFNIDTLWCEYVWIKAVAFLSVRLCFSSIWGSDDGKTEKRTTTSEWTFVRIKTIVIMYIVLYVCCHRRRRRRRCRRSPPPLLLLTVISVLVCYVCSNKVIGLRPCNAAKHFHRIFYACVDVEMMLVRARNEHSQVFASFFSSFFFYYECANGMRCW